MIWAICSLQLYLHMQSTLHLHQHLSAWPCMYCIVINAVILCGAERLHITWSKSIIELKYNALQTMQLLCSECIEFVFWIVCNESQCQYYCNASPCNVSSSSISHSHIHEFKEWCDSIHINISAFLFGNADTYSCVLLWCGCLSEFYWSSCIVY